MATTQDQQPWWNRNDSRKQESLQARIRAINQINDPTTNVDEVLRWGTRALYLSLVFTGLLAGFSYFNFFGRSFPYEIALFFAIAITILIEFGKNYCALWALRYPMFYGIGWIGRTVHNTILFFSITAIAISTFYMSVKNSTTGAERLSLLLSQQKSEHAFSPDTKDIDQQIASAEKRINDAQAIKWKGTVTYESQKTITSAQRAITTLQTQRDKVISQQRADFERLRAQNDGNNAESAGMMLKSGGWIELLQILLILLKVSCEKFLASPQRQEQQPQQQGIGFKNMQTPATAYSDPRVKNGEQEERRPIGFYRNNDPTPNTDHTCDTPVTQRAPTHVVQSGLTGDELLKWYLTELQREPSNIRSKDAKNETVLRRIREKIDKCYAGVEGSAEGSFSRIVATRFCNYAIATIAQILDEKGDAQDREYVGKIGYLCNMIEERTKPIQV